MKELIGKDFAASLSFTTPDISGAVGHDSSRWLAADGTKTQFYFQYLSHTQDRLLYNIYDTENRYSIHRLGISTNGYLGFYTVAPVSEPWKVQLTTPWELGQPLRFVLRDSVGRRVGLHNGVLFNIHSYPIAQFSADILQFLKLEVS